MRAALSALLLVAAAFPAHRADAQPRTAIPWLSDSVALPAAPPPRPRQADAAPAPGAATITVTPLGEINRDAVGLLAPARSGLPRTLWGDIAAPRVRDMLLEHPDQGPPAARALFRRLLLAEADPPADSGVEAAVLIARIDRLLDLGALDEAEALILAAGPETPEIFRRWFDIGLLTGRAKDQCTALRQNPALSPTLPARVFCLARGGDWNAAEITLTLGQNVGSITPDQEALLARFLDPVLFEEDPVPPIPRPLTALDFTLREAVGLPRPPGALPLAFLWGDLDEHAPMRMRVSAGERLARAGSLPPERLFAAYRAGVPAASGGVWDRARAVQDLDAALAAGAPQAVAEALAAADAAFAAQDLRVAFAATFAAALADLDAAALADAARERVAELLLLAGQADAATRAAGAAPSPRLAGLLAVAGAAPAPADIADPRLAAALGGLEDRAPRDERETRIAATIAAGRTGEALLEALDLLGAGPGIDPGALEAALFAIAAAGQREAARAIALQTLPPQGG